jgi:glucan phosphoethanolaminetransferase (alkaline phosphatase superfamily)
VAALATGTAVVLTGLDLWLLHLSPVSYLVSAPKGNPAMVYSVRAAGAVALLLAEAAFVWATLVSPRPVQVAALAGFAAITFLQYGFVIGGGGLLNVHDIPMSFQNEQYWPAVLHAFFDWRAAVPVAVLALIAYAGQWPTPGWRRTWLVAIVLTVMVHGVFTARGLTRDVETDEPGPGIPPMSAFQAFWRTSAMFLADETAARLRPETRQTVPPMKPRPPGTPGGHLVLVIDESVNAEHLSLNGYERSTTPWLEARVHEGAVTNFGAVASASTYSDASVCVLLTGFNAYPDVHHRLFTLPTLFQFAKAMGYRTHLFDAELAGRRFGLSWSDLKYVDDWRNARAFGDDFDADVRMARAARAVLAEPDLQLIVLLKRGNHVPPQANFRPEEAVWTSPAASSTADATHEAIDAYDDGLRYNVDAFFRALLQPDGHLPHSVGLYTSDHGESLGADGSLPFVRGLTHEVLTVPLMMFGDDRPAVDTAYRASHQNVFPTLLDLMGVPVSARQWSYSRSLLDAHADDRDVRPALGGFMFGPRFFFEVRDYDDLSRLLASSNPGPH